MSNFDYLRTILKSDNTDVLLKAFKSLSNEGLEVYVQNFDNTFHIANEKNIKKTDCLLVPAADWDFAYEILSLSDMDSYLTECIKPDSVKTDVEIAREKFFKKRKWTYIETAVIIVIAMIYYFYKTILH